MFAKDNNLWQKQKTIFICIREIRKVSDSTEMNFGDQSKKNWIDFLFHCNLKRGQESIH